MMEVIVVLHQLKQIGMAQHVILKVVVTQKDHLMELGLTMENAVDLVIVVGIIEKEQ